MRQLKRASDLTKEHLKDPEYRKLYEEVAREEAQKETIMLAVSGCLVNPYIANIAKLAQQERLEIIQAENKRLNETVAISAQDAIEALRGLEEAAQPKPKAQLHAWDKKQMRNKPWR